VHVPQIEEMDWNYVVRRSFEHSSDDSSSSASYAKSTFSIATLASSASDLSRSSGYSVVQIARATTELLCILQDDQGLVPLYRRAISDSMIGPAKLERNLHRFFKVYAGNLGDLAGDRLEHLASQLVKKQAKLVARSITEKYREYGTKQEAPHQAESSSKQEREQSSDEEGEAYSVDETEFQDLVSFRTFLVGSGAFAMLQKDIRSFTLPKSGTNFTSSRALVDKLLNASKETVPRLRRDRSWTLQALWKPMVSCLLSTHSW
jgi:hypothetical protein